MNLIIVAILIFIGIQLYNSNRINLQKLEDNKIKDEEEKEYEQLKHYYPHLVHEILDVVETHYRDSLAYNERFKKDLEYGVDSDDYPVASHTQILIMISKEYLKDKKDKELTDKMESFVKFSRKFIERVDKERKITRQEKGLVLFLVWERIYENISGKEDILKMDLDTIKWWHEEYEEFFPKK